MNAVEFLEGLVRIPSPTGREDQVVEYLRRRARADGLRVLEDAVGNFVAEAGHGPRLLLFVGHVDTVPGDIPVRRENGTLWGRGSVDAKGPLAAFYLAALRHKDSDRLTIRIVGAVDEEGRSRGAKAVPQDLQPSWIIIGEPSGFNGLTLGYKGILRGGFRVVRERSHGAHPRPTAVEDAIAFWHAVQGAYKFDNHFQTVSGRLDHLQTTTDGLHDHVEARFNLRLPPDVDPQRVREELEDLAGRHEVRIEVEETVQGALADKRNALVAAFLTSIRGRGLQPQLKQKTGTSDFNIFAARHPGVPIAAYGPGDAALDHTPHEHIQVAEFTAAVDILDDVFRRLGAD